MNTCIIFISVIIIIAGVITPIVYDIKALMETSNREVYDLCPSSKMWYFILITLITSNLTILINIDRNPIIISINGIILSLCTLIWGCVELFSVSCVDNLKGTLIYTMTLVNVSLSAIFIVVLLIYLIYLFSYVCASRLSYTQIV